MTKLEKEILKVAVAVINSGRSGKGEMCFIIATSPVAVGPWQKEEISKRPLIFSW